MIFKFGAYHDGKSLHIGPVSFTWLLPTQFCFYPIPSSAARIRPIRPWTPRNKLAKIFSWCCRSISTVRKIYGKNNRTQAATSNSVLFSHWTAFNVTFCD